MRELFVYYHVDAADGAAVRALVHDFQAALMKRHPALLARFLVRPDLKDGQQTCMEAYATDPSREAGGVGSEWQAELEAGASELAPLLRSPRHVEVFLLCR